MKKKIVKIGLYLLFIGLVFSSSEVKKGSLADLNLLLITLDTTRSDVIGLYGNTNNVTPNIDRLGQNSIIFKNCYANVPLTLPAHCSLFTGRYPHVHQVRNNGTYFLTENELTLAEIYKAQGFMTAAMVASFTVSSKFGLDQGFDFYDENFGSSEVSLNFKTEITADRVYEKFWQWLESNNDQKFFCWVHFYDPHFPYVFHDTTSAANTRSQWESYESEIRYVDAHIGKMIDLLKTKKLMENTVIVIVGNHGEAFGEHGEFGHGIFCYEESLKVPLIIHNPIYFKEKRIVTEKFSLVDILPTLLELHDFSIPKDIQGKSLLPLIRGKREKGSRTIYFESMFAKEENNWAPPIGIIDNGFKFISLPVPELYDMKKDPGETYNIFEKERKIARDLKDRLEKLLRDSPVKMNASTSKRRPTQSDIQKLESLGYISSDSNRSKQVMDPKIGITVYAQVREVNDLLKQKNYRSAEEKYEEIIQNNPGIEIPSIYQIAYQLEKSKGNTQAAINILGKALALFPEHESLKIKLAREFFMAGESSECEKLCHQLLGKNSKMTAAYILLGDLNKSLNKTREALEYYEKAMTLEPQNNMLKVNYIALLISNNELKRSLVLVNQLRKDQDFVQTSAYLHIISELSSGLLANNNITDAMPLIKKVIELDPKNPVAWLNLGSAYFSLNQFDSALEIFQKTLEIDKRFALAQSNIGLVYLSKYYVNKDRVLFEKAMESFEEAIRLSPSLGEAFYGRALASFSIGKRNDAVKDFALAIELNPDLIDAYFNISSIFEEMGNYSQALKYLTLCKERFYGRLSQKDQGDLDRLIAEVKSKIK